MTACLNVLRVTVGDGVVLSSRALLAGHVEVGDRAVIGGAAAVQQFVRIGAYAFIAGGAMVGRRCKQLTLA